MNTFIQNAEQLLSAENKKIRSIALTIINSALEASNPYKAVKKLVHINGKTLRVGSQTYDLSKKRDIYILGAGKASFPIAQALEEVLGENITRGLAVLKKGQNAKLRHIKTVEAFHPIPDVSGLRAAKDMLQLANQAQEGDLVFACITGGSSALLPLPIDSMSLSDIKQIDQLLLSSGASIIEINSVRKHLSKIKGGRLALAIFPAELINLTVSDVIGDPLDYITGPTVPDTSTFEDALKTLQKYNLLNKVSPSVRDYLKSAQPRDETPKDFRNNSYHNYILANNETACEAAAQAAKKIGLKTMILSTMLDGESREVGKTFAAIAKEIRKYKRPLKSPCVIIGGGESTVSLNKNFGKGGPNQEFVVSTLLSMEGQKDFIVVGLDTDGTDGPTVAAGAIADDFTIEKANSRGINLHRSLQEHKVFSALTSLDHTIITGQTGTNVNDLKLLILL